IGFRSFLLGTDELGRDMLSRLVYGGRMSLLMGLTPVVLATIIGGTLGVMAGFVGGSINMLIMRAIDIFYAFPSVLLAVAISGTMGGGMSNGLIALTLVFIPPLCRIAETATTQVRGLDFAAGRRRQRRAAAVDHRTPRPWHRACPRLHLCLKPHLRRHLARRRAILSWPRCGTADARLGLDALHAAAGDLRRALRLRPAGV